MVAGQQLAVLGAKLGQFVEPLDVDDPGRVGLDVVGPGVKGFVADSHVPRRGALRLAARCGVAHGGELERLGEMPAGVASRTGVGDRRNDGRILE